MGQVGIWVGDRLVAPPAAAPAASGNLEIWEFRELEIWEFGNLGTWKSRNLEANKSKKWKFSKSKFILPKKVGKVWIRRKKKPSRPHLGPSQATFSMDQKNQKNVKVLSIFLGGPMGPIHPVWGCFTQMSKESWFYWHARDRGSSKLLP